MEPPAFGTREFSRRARHECERYGHDTWVFVRELLQNARDAGATRVLFTGTLEAGGGFAVTCRDDGCGMSFEHARRYLFRLYASSKDGRRGAAGRFGVGFWSLLAFEPLAIVVQSWPTSGEPWELELDGELLAARRGRPTGGGRGTSVRVRRAAAPGEARERLAQAVSRYGRFLTRLDAPQRALDVRVDGRPVAEPFDLPAPRARFERRGLRGVVGLGPEPRVELLVKGLPVRNAACLQDLLAPEGRPGRAARTELGAGLAPVVLLDSHDVEVQITRDEPRASGALERLVAAAEDELDLLIEGQLDCLRPEPVFRRAWRRLTLRPTAPWLVAGAAAALVTLLGASLLREPAAAAVASFAQPRAAPAPLAPAAAARTLAPQRTVAYRDLGRSYAGPWSNLASDALGPPLALRYSPAGERPRFVALVADPLEAAPGEALDDGPYAGPACERDCLSVELSAVAQDGGWLRLPVPSGHRLDPASVSVDGTPAEPRASARDEALVALPAGAAARVRYRSGPGPARALPLSRAERLPAEFATAARRLSGLHERERPGAARDWVAAHVRYSIAPETAARHRRLERRAFLERALLAGAGDCDVQNGVLALLLQAAGTPARLAIGYLGREGEALPWLHGWAEYVGPDGAWHELDASEPQVLPGVVRAPLADPQQAGAPKPTLGDPRPIPAPAEPSAAEAFVAPSHAAPNARWLGVTAGLALLAATLVFWRRRGRRELKLDRGAQLVELLRGVLQNPQAFDHLPSVLRRPLLSRLGAGPLALGRAWSLAAAARLFASRRHAPLARRAAAGGLSVLDVNREEARLAAEALGAIDLDEWQEHLGRACDGPLQAANTHLRARGEDWRVAVVAGLGEARLLRLPGVPLEPGEHAERLLLVDAGEGWLRPEGRPPARFRYETLARLSELAGSSAGERQRLLELPALDALREGLT